MPACPATLFLFARDDRKGESSRDCDESYPSGLRLLGNSRNMIEQMSGCSGLCNLPTSHTPHGCLILRRERISGPTLRISPASSNLWCLPASSGEKDHLYATTSS